MKTNWSKTWGKSTQPRKQRKYNYNAPFHVRHKLMSAHLSQALRKKTGRRAMPLKRGDEVKVLRGSKKGLKGKIFQVDLKKLVVNIEGQTRESTAGTKIPIPFKPSNLLITSLNLDDDMRAKSMESFKKLKAEQAKAERDKKEETKEKSEKKPKKD